MATFLARLIGWPTCGAGLPLAVTSGDRMMVGTSPRDRPSQPVPGALIKMTGPDILQPPGRVALSTTLSGTTGLRAACRRSNQAFKEPRLSTPEILLFIKSVGGLDVFHGCSDNHF